MIKPKFNDSNPMKTISNNNNNIHLNDITSVSTTKFIDATKYIFLLGMNFQFYTYQVIITLG